MGYGGMVRVGSRVLVAVGVEVTGQGYGGMVGVGSCVLVAVGVLIGVALGYGVYVG